MVDMLQLKVMYNALKISFDTCNLQSCFAYFEFTTSSLRLRTLPSRRHVAKEFLDESVLATMSRSRTPLNNKIGVNQIIQVHSEAVMTTAHTLPSGALVSLN
ncbi:unnamed protein product, partial [Schistosoma mattheei]